MSVRLSAHARRRFVEAVMNSLPASDYVAQKNEFIVANARESLPAPIKALLGTEYECWLNQEWYYHPIGAYMYSPRGVRNSIDLSPEATEHIRKLDEKINAEVQRRKVLKNVLANMVSLCTNSNQLKYGLPELKQFLPQRYLELPPPVRKVKIPEAVINDRDVVMELLLEFGMELED